MMTLLAFKVDGQEGLYNVWRYDTPSTENILFCYKAGSNEEAIKAAEDKIRENSK